jgi:GGDEF domain-containing protein
METWAAGSDHIDSPTRLRDDRQFENAVYAYLGLRPTERLRHSLILIELALIGSETKALNEESDFLRDMGATLARFARGQFAYRCGENQFAIFLPYVSKHEACKLSKNILPAIRSVISKHTLSDRYFVAIGVLGFPEQTESSKETIETAEQLVSEARGYGGGIALAGVGVIEPPIRNEVTRLLTERFFMEVLSAEWKRSERNNRIFSLIDIQLGAVT